MALWENHESHHLCNPSLKQRNGHLRSACGKIRWLVRAVLGLTSDEEGNGPVRTNTRGRDESALLQGGCLEEVRPRSREDGLARGVEKTSALFQAASPNDLSSQGGSAILI